MAPAHTCAAVPTPRRRPGVEVTPLDPGLGVLGALTMERACWYASCSGASMRVGPPVGMFANSTGALSENAMIEDARTCRPRLRACIPVR